MTVKNRTDLKSYFVKNAIPTEGNFADLIDSPLNQAQDGVFKLDGEPLSVVAAAGDQKRVLRLYATYPQGNPDWMISLNPAQDPASSATVRAGFGITDGTGKTRLFVDSATGNVGVGTNNPQVALDVTGVAQANGFRGRYDLVLNDYRTANPASNVCLRSPANDRDAWIYRDSVDSGSNWGIYHRQVEATIAGLPQNSIAFVGGGSSKLQAYVCLGDGSGFFSGPLTIGGMLDITTQTGTWGGWLEAIRFSRPEHGAITHPGGKLLFGLHSDRNFYWADTNAGRYVMTLSGATGMLSVPYGINVGDTTVPHIEKDGAFYRNSDGQVYITVDDNLYIRDSGSATWAAHFDTNSGSLELKGALTARGFGMLTDPAEKFNCHFPHSNGNSYVTGNNVVLRAGGPTWGEILVANGATKDVTIAGNLGTHGYAATNNAPGFVGGIVTWDVTSHGTIWSVNGYKQNHFDIAERFANHEEGLEAGDVVAIDPRTPERLVRPRGAQSDLVVGVVSTAPGYELGVSWEQPDAGVPLALAGRVPVKVNLEGGPIRIGDYLTSSSVPGIAMRTIRSGRVLGMALSAYDGGDDAKVIVFVNPHWFGGR